MATELSLFSMTQLQNLAQQNQQLNANWNPTKDSSWPPRRTYTCSFCHREFRSAQALGGHMNVHRRDRARLRQSPGPSIDFSSVGFESSTGGLCLFYPISSHGDGLPCTLLPMRSTPSRQSAALNLLSGMAGSMGGQDGEHGISNYNLNDGMVINELDLELRL